MPLKCACAHCGVIGARYKCGGCSLARYCSKQCQRASWSIHKSFCGAIDAEQGLALKKQASLLYTILQNNQTVAECVEGTVMLLSRIGLHLVVTHIESSSATLPVLYCYASQVSLYDGPESDVLHTVDKGRYRLFLRDMHLNGVISFYAKASATPIDIEPMMPEASAFFGSDGQCLKTFTISALDGGACVIEELHTPVLVPTSHKDAA